LIYVLSTNITAPLGFTTEQNYRAVRSGVSALKRYDGLWGLPEPFAASLFNEEQKASLALDGYTFFESLAIHSVREALSHTQLDVTSPEVVLILSTTKGNIGQSPSEAAQRIATAIGLTTTPIVVCNACVSGLSAQLLADHLLSAGLYDYAVVVGAEVQSEFIVSGFQSLKAVSDEPCRPFDIERNGLNPGEAAATIVFKTPSKSPRWYLVNGAICNDAFHISSPSPQANGLTAAIETVMEGQDKSELASICVHGTGTLYNDQMESKAIQRAGLSDIPLSALKGYYGHTMGAAGVLETILTMRATDDGIVLPSKGFTELGVSGKVSISSECQQTNKISFLKLLSGFGGNNVAALYSRDMDCPSLISAPRCQSIRVPRLISAPRCESIREDKRFSIIKTHTIRISSDQGKSLTDIYKQQIGNYPKFYKMDILTRLAFVASELLIKDLGKTQVPRLISAPWLQRVQEEPAIILFNHSSSLVADRQFLKTISDAENFFPSPSVFVYTLPNITTGEIAIRHHLCGETSFCILPEKDEALMQQILKATLNATKAKSVISGWIDAESETTFECELSTYNII
jgi:3-oxoacyl-[acyl-carrier-protein] synthase-1